MKVVMMVTVVAISLLFNAVIFANGKYDIEVAGLDKNGSSGPLINY